MPVCAPYRTLSTQSQRNPGVRGVTPAAPITQHALGCDKRIIKVASIKDRLNNMAKVKEE